MQHRRIAILGSAPSLKDTPRDGFEYWSLMSNWTSEELPVKPDRWFEFHSVPHLKKVGVQQDAIQALETMENLWMMHPVGKANQFPRDEVLKLGAYFTSSIAWMIGLAILEQPESIGLYGVDLILEEEYMRQRACVEAWANFARAKGIEVIIPESSPLMKGLLYCDDTAWELQERHKAAKERIKKAEYDLAFARGAETILKDLRYTR